MWTKIFFGALAVAVLPVLFLYFYAYSWLGSIGAPADVVANYSYYIGLAWNYLWIATLVLLILANVILWQTRRAWALWATFAYFAVFVTARYFWLDQSFANYQQAKNLTQSGVSFGVFAGVLYVVLFAVITFFNQFIVTRLNARMYPQTATEPADVNLNEAEIVETDSERN